MRCDRPGVNHDLITSAIAVEIILWDLSLCLSLSSLSKSFHQCTLGRLTFSVQQSASLLEDIEVMLNFLDTSRIAPQLQRTVL